MKLAHGRAPNYRIKEEFRGLPQGSFIRPIRRYYIPEHIFDEISPYFNEDEEIICSTSMGFILIPWKIIEET